MALAMRARSDVSRVVGWLQQRLAGSDLAVALAIKARNQADGIIGRRLGVGIDPLENGEALLAQVVGPDVECFVDVGANVGHWTQLLLSFGAQEARGLLFEPSPIAAERLRAWAHQHRRLEVVEAALAERPATMPFFAELDAGETSSLVPPASARLGTLVDVSVTTLDGEMRARGIDFVDFIKIDAEGYDLKVLEGATDLLARQALGVVQFEYNATWRAAGSTLLAAAAMLERHGYKLMSLQADGLRNLDVLRLGEFYRYSNFVALSPNSKSHVASIIRD